MSISLSEQVETASSCPEIKACGEKLEVVPMEDVTIESGGCAGEETSQKKKRTLKRFFTTQWNSAPKSKNMGSFEGECGSGGDEDAPEKTESKGKVTKILHRVQSKANKMWESLGSVLSKDESAADGGEGSAEVASVEPDSDALPKPKTKTLKRLTAGLTGLVARSPQRGDPPSTT